MPVPGGNTSRREKSIEGRKHQNVSYAPLVESEDTTHTTPVVEVDSESPAADEIRGSHTTPAVEVDSEASAVQAASIESGNESVASRDSHNNSLEECIKDTFTKPYESKLSHQQQGHLVVHFQVPDHLKQCDVRTKLKFLSYQWNMHSLLLDYIADVFNRHSKDHYQGQDLFAMKLDDTKTLFDMDVIKAFALIAKENPEYKPESESTEPRNILIMHRAREKKDKSGYVVKGKRRGGAIYEDFMCDDVSMECIKIITDAGDLTNDYQKYMDILKGLCRKYPELQKINAKEFVDKIFDVDWGDSNDQHKIDFFTSNYCFLIHDNPHCYNLFSSLISNRDDLDALAKITRELQHMSRMFFLENQYKKPMRYNLLAGLELKVYNAVKFNAKAVRVNHENKYYCLSSFLICNMESVQLMVDTEYHHKYHKKGSINPRSAYKFSLKRRNIFNKDQSLICLFNAPGRIGVNTNQVAADIDRDLSNLEIHILELKHCRDSQDNYDLPDYARCYLTAVIIILEKYIDYFAATNKQDKPAALNKLQINIENFNKLFPFAPELFRFDRFFRSAEAPATISDPGIVLEYRMSSEFFRNTLEEVSEEEVEKYSQRRSEFDKDCVDQAIFVARCAAVGFHNGRVIQEECVENRAEVGSQNGHTDQTKCVENRAEVGSQNGHTDQTKCVENRAEVGSQNGHTDQKNV